MQPCKMSLDLNTERGNRDGGEDILIQDNGSLSSHPRLSVTYSMDSPELHPTKAEVWGLGLVKTNL